jgi:hypothetical protein
MTEKDIRFTNKRVDDSWKESVSGEPSKDKPSPPSEGPREDQNKPIDFTAFITSLGVQCLIHLGELKIEKEGEPKINLQAASEAIDLLVMLKEKTKGNLKPEEEVLLEKLVADLQLKFVHSSSKQS